VVTAAGDEHLAETAERRPARAPVRERQQRMVCAPAAVGLDRLRIRRGRELRLPQQVRVTRRSGANRAEEVAVRLLRRMPELPLERMYEDRGAAVDDREGVSPEPEREPEAEVRREQRVRSLAREIRCRAGDPEAERVERLAERPGPLLRPAQQRLGVRRRRRPRERGRDAARRGNRPQHASADRARHRAEDVPHR
jgi:hypothetical protein